MPINNDVLKQNTNEDLSIRIFNLAAQFEAHIDYNREQHAALEAKLAEFEDYFNTIESILTKIQAVYEAIKEQGKHD